MNLKVRIKNPVFWIQLLLTICTTVATYAGISAADLNTWAKLWEVIVATFCNPYCLFLVAVSLWNILNDPTTSGVTDSTKAMSYNSPNKE